MKDWSIRPMQEQDTAQIAALEAACFSMPWSENAIRSELDNPISDWLVAERGEEILGYVGAQSVMEEADVMNLAVRESARRQGLGAALLRALMALLRERGVEKLLLEVRASNAPAIGLYEKLGFVQVGCRKNYYLMPREDALILCAALKMKEEKPCIF